MIAQYLLAIPPSTSVANKVINLKVNLHNEIGAYTAFNSEPHLTIASVFISDKKQPILCKTLSSTMAHEDPLFMTASNLGYYISSQTIYVIVKEIKQFSNLSKNISKSPFIHSLPTNYKYSCYDPHLTIGKNLKQKFEQACNWCTQYAYEETFTANSAVLLRRYIGGRYELVQEFSFGGKPSGQLSLL